MKLRSLVFATLASYASAGFAQSGLCRTSVQPSNVPRGQVLVVCGDMSELTRTESGDGVPRERVGLMSGSTTVTSGTLTVQRQGGSRFMIGAPLGSPMTIEQISRLSGQQLIALYPNIPASVLSTLDPATARFEYDVDDHLQKFTPSRCTYISSEVRDVNLLRFLTSNNCTNAGSCLPSRIQLCSVRIGCNQDPLYGTVEWGTVCKANNGQCPSVDECIRDDAAMTRTEAQELNRLKNAPGAASL